MKKVIAPVLITLIMGFVTQGVCSISIYETFESGKSSSFSDETGGTFNLSAAMGNTYAKFSIATGYDPGYYENIVSSIVFYNVPVTEWTGLISFDYNFNKSVFLPENTAMEDFDFSGADYFSVSMIHDSKTYYLFQHSFDPIDLTDTIFSPEGIEFTTYTASGSMFTHVRLNLADFFTANSLVGQMVDVYFEILNGSEINYYTDESLTVQEFQTEVNVDNIYMGVVPEPSFYAMFVFGLAFLFQRIKKRIKHIN